ncbi:hypothetical protein HELRODRAFT_161629 [Helobdella robusta]|uniref:BED-type domain-containing protein n=1 Tax=Helobdella robusta TaxID=6412 RepID=T1ERQ5_HELRO|nr:hypothetical protein HELRODRAFT_161629 [Helobdella robusta]ESO02369.1 hypothetical protein HELRODRAFT_161629 [Helobdella robusta]
MKTGRKRASSVWDYFTYDDKLNKSKCSALNSKDETCVFSLAGKNPSNLKTHLRSRHPASYAVVEKCKTDNNGKTTLSSEKPASGDEEKSTENLETQSKYKQPSSCFVVVKCEEEKNRKMAIPNEERASVGADMKQCKTCGKTMLARNLNRHIQTCSGTPIGPLAQDKDLLAFGRSLAYQDETNDKWLRKMVEAFPQIPKEDIWKGFVVARAAMSELSVRLIPGLEIPGLRGSVPSREKYVTDARRVADQFAVFRTDMNDWYATINPPKDQTTSVQYNSLSEPLTNTGTVSENNQENEPDSASQDKINLEVQSVIIGELIETNQDPILNTICEQVPVYEVKPDITQLPSYHSSSLTPTVWLNESIKNANHNSETSSLGKRKLPESLISGELVVYCEKYKKEL